MEKNKPIGADASGYDLLTEAVLSLLNQYPGLFDDEVVKFEELEKEYYNAVDSSLGSQCEDMYELGYDNADIVEREKYEKYLGQRADLLSALCEQRGIKLWKKE